MKYLCDAMEQSSGRRAIKVRRRRWKRRSGSDDNNDDGWSFIHRER